MPLFLTQVAYTPEAWQAMINNPQDRLEAIKPALKKLGGKIVSGYLSFGDYDTIAIVVSAAGMAMAFAAGGACKNVKTTPLMTAAEGLDALKKAANCGYKPVTAAAAAAAGR